jgi:hypothetical protein
MKEGFYSIRYQGVAGGGFGVLVLDSGMIYGVDITGVQYDGTYSFNPVSGKIDAKIEISVPPGVWLVTGAPASATGYKMEMPVSLPRDLGAEHPFAVTTQNGILNVIFKKIRDFPVC